MSSHFVDAMNPFPFTFSEYDDSLVDMSGDGTSQLDDALDNVNNTPRAVSTEFSSRPPNKIPDSLESTDRSHQSVKSGQGSDSHLWPSSNLWRCGLHPEDLSLGGLESSSSTNSTSSVNSIMRSSRSHKDLDAQSVANDGIHRRNSDGEFGEMWNAAMQNSPGSPHTKGSASSSDLAATLQYTGYDNGMSTPPFEPRQPTPIQMHSFEDTSATPSERGSETIRTPSASLTGQSHESSPINMRSPFFLGSWNSESSSAPIQHFPNLAGLSYATYSDHGSGHPYPSPISSSAMQAMTLDSPHALFIDPQSTQAEARPSSSTSFSVGTSPSWSTLTPAMAGASLHYAPSVPAALTMSPTQISQTSPMKAPRKAQSTPVFQFATSGAADNPSPSMPSSSTVARARGTSKAIRKHASNKRMNSNNSGLSVLSPSSDAKSAGTSKLRARGSMMALRQANAMHAASKSPTTANRRPMALSFVNYGINDADELCSAVAPSGSYKVPLHGYSQDSEDAIEGMSSAKTKQAATRERLHNTLDTAPLRHTVTLERGMDKALPETPSEIKRRQTTSQLRENSRR
ncbi:hypothetical protein MYAM1_000860 [Malassezia yamatoensis]|uniref:Uncharacterized protein n=1 Tax=Malassezia yamatoensis TaxID=253288 RepID=A0AAJ5YST7_9BASI|nr:hypothetical protein MYAM1_000860 [Malassezia yamatoensis]